MTIGEQLLTIFVFLAVPLIFIGVPVFVFTGGLEKFALKPLMRRFEGLDISETPRPGDVSIRYHTYRGFLLWFTQNEFAVHAPPKDARILLGRLMRFNLTWAMPGAGLVFVPFLAIGNYFTQSISIDRQQDELEANNPTD